MATGRQQVFATLRYVDAPAAIEWLKAALGFVEHEIHTNEDGTIAHAELAFGNDLVMLGSTEAPPTLPPSIWRMPMWTPTTQGH